jgi:Flp pilus assembly pilin Flp
MVAMTELENKMISITNFCRNEQGQTLSEYALILFLIAVFAIGAVTLLGTNINKVLGQIAAAV